jgi:hypothetical protein
MALGMSAVLHGGPDASGAAPHDFSTNGNAVGPCPIAVAALRQADAAHYPDPHYTALRGRLADFHGVASERIVIAASASEFIHRISAAVMQQGGRAAWLPAHSYGDYERAARAWGLQVLRAPQAPDGAALRWCCEPSSPLGQPQADLPQHARERRRRLRARPGVRAAAPAKAGVARRRAARARLADVDTQQGHGPHRYPRRLRHRTRRRRMPTCCNASNASPRHGRWARTAWRCCTPGPATKPSAGSRRACAP